jgi:methionyl-tRNA formyltransferase
MAAAVVFAYHDVGVRCLSVLLAHGIDVRLVVTHEDDPSENVWFGSVAALARRHGLAVVTTDDASRPDVVAGVRAAAPDFLFSFYFRRMIAPDVLAIAPRGAFNMHGSLLPNYRGRVPVNWAVLRGERATGATLHEMVAKPDAGRIVDQASVPILPNDTAGEVFAKVTVAAEIVLDRALPKLVDGSARLVTQDLAQGSYFTGRRPEDGRLDFAQPARALHDLVRAVAPPYPGTFADVGGHRLRILRTWWRGETTTERGRPALVIDGERLLLRATDGGLLDVLAAELDGRPLDAAALRAIAGADSFPLETTT